MLDQAKIGERPLRVRQGQRGPGAWITIAGIATTATVLLGACGLIMGEQLDGLMIPITNNTDQDLTVRSGGGADEGDVKAGATVVVEFARVECTRNVNATTDDKSFVMLRPGDICEGDTWVIEQGDLRPYQEVFPALVDVVNDTRVVLTIHSRGEVLGTVRTGDMVTVELPGGECADLVTAVSEDGSSAAFQPGGLCGGGRWVISGDELEPNDEEFPRDR